MCLFFFSLNGAYLHGSVARNRVLVLAFLDNSCSLDPINIERRRAGVFGDKFNFSTAVKLNSATVLHKKKVYVCEL